MNKAPAFSLPDQNGATRSLAEFAGTWLIVYFYPKDDTPGCTTEACSFRDEYRYLQEKGLNVVGISKDSVASHAKFAAKYGLNFPLLSDESAGIIKAYGAWGLGTKRTTFLINPEGGIAKEYPKVTPKDHAVEILRDFEALS
ncbi:MAG: alkyl hydroperoxide reductase/Thiol specific antioxidant/Mal allergen [Patescibacteria group bacterium]|nr:alkyl hydroperoxide reductase/Thiol specific antioxidant/Mal allergen [Patescibacteria group bacterium]